MVILDGSAPAILLSLDVKFARDFLSRSELCRVGSLLLLLLFGQYWRNLSILYGVLYLVFEIFVVGWILSET